MSRVRPLIITAFFSLTLVASLSTTALAQVVVTLGVQEVYDDNIFLENDKGTLPEEFSDPENLPPGVTEEDLEQIDGDPNDDITSIITLGVSTAVPTGKYVTTGYEAKVGSIIFADQSDESRLAIDSHLKLDGSEKLLPRPWAVSLESVLESQVSDVSAAEGTSTRQDQSHSANFRLGVESWEFMPRTTLSSSYKFTRFDFLDEFLFDDDNNESGLFEARGSDYISNAIDLRLGRELTQQLQANFDQEVAYLAFTSAESSTGVDIDSEDLDRLDYRSRVGVSYQQSQTLSFDAFVGLDLSSFSNSDNNPSVADSNDDTQTSLAFGSSVNYLPDQATVISAEVEQTAGTNIDGGRITTRGIAVDIARSLTDRLRLSTGGRYSQFNDGDTLSESSDRFEASVAFSYNVYRSVAVSAGYNYVKQTADNQAGGSVFTFSDDYESNRLFVSISGGLVGTT